MQGENYCNFSTKYHNGQWIGWVLTAFLTDLITTLSTKITVIKSFKLYKKDEATRCRNE